MKTYAVKFEAELPDDMEAVERSFYEHFDGLVALSFGRLLVTLYMDEQRNGVSAAKCAAIELHKRLRVVATRIDRDLVDASEIARRIDRTRESVRQIINGTRHKGESFPTPLGAPNGKKIWEWAIVNEWLRRNVLDTAESEFYLNRDEMTVVDNWLLRWGTMSREHHVRSEFHEITQSEVVHAELRGVTSRTVHEGWVSSWNLSRDSTRSESVSTQSTG